MMIKLRNTVLILFLFFSFKTLYAQDFLLLGEGRQDQVKLFWIPKQAWDSSIIGFNIKRKAEQDWKKLNAEVIVPGTTKAKKLNNLGLKSNELANLKEKRNQFIESGGLKEIETQQLIDYMSDEQTLKGISLLLNSDYSKALIAG
ncbi:MAG: hypothetical protein R3345_11105, partial [Fulvivirga sp.]|nr:hypothetical protein [Fulvivirga sp.]